MCDCVTNAPAETSNYGDRLHSQCKRVVIFSSIGNLPLLPVLARSVSRLNHRIQNSFVLVRRVLLHGYNRPIGSRDLHADMNIPKPHPYPHIMSSTQSLPRNLFKVFPIPIPIQNPCLIVQPVYNLFIYAVPLELITLRAKLSGAVYCYRSCL